MKKDDIVVTLVFVVAALTLALTIAVGLQLNVILQQNADRTRHNANTFNTAIKAVEKQVAALGLKVDDLNNVALDRIVDNDNLIVALNDEIDALVVKNINAEKEINEAFGELVILEKEMHELFNVQGDFDAKMVKDINALKQADNKNAKDIIDVGNEIVDLKTRLRENLKIFKLKTLREEL